MCVKEDVHFSDGRVCSITYFQFCAKINLLSIILNMRDVKFIVFMSIFNFFMEIPKPKQQKKGKVFNTQKYIPVSIPQCCSKH
jgi:hypothetical protein